MSVEELEALADEALAGLEHRRLDFDVVEPADALRAGFEAKGWTAERLLWMRHQAPLPAGLGISVEEVRYDAVLELRTAWHNENFPAADPSSREAERQRAGRLLSQARAVSMLWDPRVLTVSESGAPIAYAQLEREGAAAEITQVYVLPEYRGAGRGTAMTRAAIEAAGDVEDLWIVADDDDRAKKLYARLGFRPVWTTMELTRPPPPAGGED